jgi:hypothetical protein
MSAALWLPASGLNPPNGPPVSWQTENRDRGVELVVVPSPSCPLPPQHLTARPVVTAHEWTMPAERAATPGPDPTTPTGVADWLKVPSPSSPELLSPQHLTAPAVVSAHE